MSNQAIELNKEGVKISYTRFLKDAAAGYVVALFLFASYYLSVFGQPLKDKIHVTISPEVKIAILILTALLALPVGLAINALSHVFLCRAQDWVQTICYKPPIWPSRLMQFLRTWLLGAVNDGCLLEDYQKRFDLADGRQWHRYKQVIDNLFGMYFPIIKEDYSHVRGIATFFRNMAFLILLLGGASLVCNIGKLNSLSLIIAFILLPVIFSFALCMAGWLEYYYGSHLFARCYLLILQYENQTGTIGDPIYNHRDLAKIITTLAQPEPKQTAV